MLHEYRVTTNVLTVDCSYLPSFHRAQESVDTEQSLWALIFKQWTVVYRSKAVSAFKPEVVCTSVASSLESLFLKFKTGRLFVKCPLPASAACIRQEEIQALGYNRRQTALCSLNGSVFWWLRFFLVRYIQEKRDFKSLDWGFSGGSVVRNSPANAGDGGSIPGLGRSHVLWIS